MDLMSGILNIYYLYINIFHKSQVNLWLCQKQSLFQVDYLNSQSGGDEEKLNNPSKGRGNEERLSDLPKDYTR